jgi:hypothetical protein
MPNCMQLFAIFSLKEHFTLLFITLVEQSQGGFMYTKQKLSIALFILLSGICHAQFLDSFSDTRINGWFVLTGDGSATAQFVQRDGYASLLVDATKDKDNVYWTLIKRDITSSLDLRQLKDPSYELRVEAKVRVHNAPRRLNFMINTQRTTNFHEHLMEYDIDDTTDWHVISLTTKNLDAKPGDTLYVQLCATDYGLGKYTVDVDYYRADIVNVKLCGPDKGEFVPYHPAVPEVSTFTNHLGVTHDCLIHSDFPEVNFNDWHAKNAHVLTVHANQWAVLRWDFSKYRNMKVDKAGLLEVTTESVRKGGNYIQAFGEDFGIEFGKIRVIEILDGDSAWDQHSVTYNSLMQGKGLTTVFNSQMMFDADVIEEPGGKTFITVSRPVLQRLLSGKTKGLLIRPLGAIDASIYASEDLSGNGPKLHFNIAK